MLGLVFERKKWFVGPQAVFTNELHVDDDGSITAIGDGLMVIRKLFGTTFSGNSLNSKTMSNNATRKTYEIYAYIAKISNVDLLI